MVNVTYYYIFSIKFSKYIEMVNISTFMKFHNYVNKNISEALYKTRNHYMIHSLYVISLPVIE